MLRVLQKNQKISRRFYTDKDNLKDLEVEIDDMMILFGTSE